MRRVASPRAAWRRRRGSPRVRRRRSRAVAEGRAPSSTRSWGEPPQPRPPCRSPRASRPVPGRPRPRTRRGRPVPPDRAPPARSADSRRRQRVSRRAGRGSRSHHAPPAKAAHITHAARKVRLPALRPDPSAAMARSDHGGASTRSSVIKFAPGRNARPRHHVHVGVRTKKSCPMTLLGYLQGLVGHCWSSHSASTSPSACAAGSAAHTPRAAAYSVRSTNC